MTPSEQSYSGPPVVELTVRIQVDPNVMVNADRWQVDPPAPMVPVCAVYVATQDHVIAQDAWVPLSGAADHVAEAIRRYLEPLR